MLGCKFSGKEMLYVFELWVMTQLLSLENHSVRTLIPQFEEKENFGIP